MQYTDQNHCIFLINRNLRNVFTFWVVVWETGVKLMQYTPNKNNGFFWINRNLRNVFTFRVVVFFAHIALRHHAVCNSKLPTVSKVRHPTNAINSCCDFLLGPPVRPNPYSFCCKRNYHPGRNAIDKIRAKFLNFKSQFRWIQWMHNRCRKCNRIQSAAPIFFLLFTVHQSDVENFVISVLNFSNAVNNVLIRFTAIPVAIKNQHKVRSKTFAFHNKVIHIVLCMIWTHFLDLAELNCSIDPHWQLKSPPISENLRRNTSVAALVIFVENQRFDMLIFWISSASNFSPFLWRAISFC